MPTGLVIRNTGSHYTVLNDEGRRVDCRVKGNFRLKGIRSTNPVAVGDRVTYSPGEGTPAGGGAEGWITAIEDRRNYIIRRASNLSKQSHILAANVDQCLLLVTVNYPETSTTFIDRFLATAEAYRIPVRIVINKMDRYDAGELRIATMLAQLYEGLGYPCHLISCLGEGDKDSGDSGNSGNSGESGKTGTFGETGNSGLVWEAVSSLLPVLKGQKTLLSGNSGVGKSTLLNALIPGVRQKTAEISNAHNTGMHTTTFSEMFPLPASDDSWLIDTPGIKGFGTFDMEREEVSHYFRELFSISKDCRYANCTHTHEPGCAVLRALDDHLIAASRYNSYLSMLDDKDEGKYR